jgi:hypothetical protein
MSALYALFARAEAAQRAVEELRSQGVPDNDIVVITSEPLEGLAFGHERRSTPLWYVASAGGFAGMGAGAWLTRMTEVAWPLPTGNMPIVSWWPNLIIVFELTMLGAILATVGTLLVRGRLVRRMPALYDPEVAEGKILVGVEAPHDPATVERAFALAGGEPRRAPA